MPSVAAITRFRASLVIALCLIVVNNAATAPPLGTCNDGTTDFAVMTGSTNTWAGPESIIVKGSIGVAPGTSITVATTIDIQDGTQQSNTGDSIACANDGRSAYAAIMAQACDEVLATPELGAVSRSFEPKVYCSSAGTFNIAAGQEVELNNNNDPNPVWVFHAASTVITGANSYFTFTGSPLGTSADVFWGVGSSATLGASSTFVGTILAYASITLGSTSNLQGRAYAGAAVTCAGACQVDTGVSPSTPASTVAPTANIVAGIPSLGRCFNADSDFAVMAGSTSTWDGAYSVVEKGDVGVSPGTSITVATGNLNMILVDGTEQQTTLFAGYCAADGRAAYTAIMAIDCDVTIASSELGGLSLTPNAYCSAPGTFNIAASTNLILDALNDWDAVWVFHAVTTVITGGSSQVVFKDDIGHTKNVFWGVGSSATLGSASRFKGNILAYASITLGSTSDLAGRAFAGAAVTCASACNVNTGVNSSVTQTSSPTATPTPPPEPSVDIDNCFHVSDKSLNFAVMAGSANTWAGAPSTIYTGSVGVSPGTAITVASSLDINFGDKQPAGSAACAADQKAAHAVAMAYACEFTFTTPALDAKTLGPGIYCTLPGTFGMAAGGQLKLDATSDSLGGTTTHPANAIWVFHAASTVVTGASSSMLLINGAKAENVFWAVGSSATTGASSIFVGTILAFASITFGASTTVDGRAYAGAAITCAGACRIDSSGVTAPPTDSPTQSPTNTPTNTPSDSPTQYPTKSPTDSPTQYPTKSPTNTPSDAPTQSPTPPPALSLGSCKITDPLFSENDFAVMAGSANTYAGAPSTITVGSVGVYPGTAITVATTLNQPFGTKQRASAATCAGEGRAAYTKAMGFACDRTFPTPALDGKILGPGVYCTLPGTFGMAASTTLTLDGTRALDSATANSLGYLDSNIWVFHAASTVVTGASTNMVLAGGALIGNVYWAVGSSATTGASSTFVGTILAYASITMGAGTNLDGRAYAGAAVTCAASCIITSDAPIPPTESPTLSPTDSPSNTPTSNPTNTPSDAPTGTPTPAPTPAPPPALSLGDCTDDTDGSLDFAVLAGSANTWAGTPSEITIGRIGVSPGTAITVATTMIQPFGTRESNTAAAAACAADERAAYTKAMGFACDRTFPTPALDGLLLGPGVYCSLPGTFSMAAGGIVTLNDGVDIYGAAATPVPDAIWVFHAASTVVTGASSSVVLAGNAEIGNVFWAVGSSATTGASSIIRGTILAYASITMGAGTFLNGRAYAGAAVTCAASCKVTTDAPPAPTDTPTSSPTNVPTGTPTPAPTHTCNGAGINGADLDELCMCVSKVLE